MSDSSEDEIPVQLLESVDKEFLNDSLFCERRKSGSNCKNDEQLLLPSLRPKDDEDAFTQTGITKSCQTYIAKQLTKLLDEKLEKLTTQKSKNIVTSNNKVESGVLLFSDSVNYLSACDKIVPVVKKRKLNCEVDNAELKKRCKSVAVSADWILSGTATKGWCKNTKGELIHVKRLNSEESNIIEYEIKK